MSLGRATQKYTEVKFTEHTLKIYTSTDKQRGPPVEHRELYSVSCDKPQWKRIEKRMHTRV